MENFRPSSADRATMESMNPRLATRAAAQRGAFSAADAAEAGVGADEIGALVRAKTLLRVRRGAYVLAADYWDAKVFERHVMRVRAVLRSRPDGDRASHHSALTLQGIATYGVDESVVAVESRNVKRRRRVKGLVTHTWSTGRTWTVDGVFDTVDAATACAQVAAEDGFVAGVCAMDSAVRIGRCTLEELAIAVAALPALRRTIAQKALDAVDPQCESVGESRTRIILKDAGLEVRSQVSIEDAAGFVGRVDFLVGEMVIVEFDGLVKYDGFEGKRALADEKAREKRLERLGYEVVRVTWAELADPAAIIRRIREAEKLVVERRRAMRALR